MFRKRIYTLLLNALMLAACSGKHEPDLSKIKLNVKIERFDQAMDQLEPENLHAGIPALAKQYGWFYNDYMEGMIGAGSVADTGYYRNLRTVLKNTDYRELAASVASKYPDLAKQEKELTDAFKRLKFYFPEKKIPRLISFLSGFTVQTPVGNDYIGIGLDMFLGPDSKYYPALVQSIPLYISRRFSPENICPRVMEAYIRQELFQEKDEDRALLDKMIYNGKVLYLMDELMPDLADSLKIGFTEKQLSWCNEFEADIWAYFLEENLLYESDYLKIQKYLSDAPFTPGLGEGNESAPKLGVWMGWQIVRRYMDKHPGTTLQQLLAKTDAQQLLKESRYNPK